VNTFYAVAQIGLCTCLTVLMVRLHGLIGAAAGSGIAYLIGGITYLVHSTLIFRIPFSRLVNRAILCKVLLLSLPGILLWALSSHHPPRGVLEILLQSGLFGILYSFLVARYLIDDYDIAKIAVILPAVRYLSFLRG